MANLQLARAVLYLLGAVALVVVLRGVTLPVNLFYMTSDSLTSQTQTVFVPALHSLLDAPISIMAAIGLLVSGLFGLYRYTKGKAAYAKEIKNGISPMKWLDLGISSAIMMEIVAMLAGVSDLVTLKISAGLIVLACYLGWLVERQNAKVSKTDWSAYAGSVFSGILAWLPIAGSLFFTWLYGSVRLPWYSYALVAAVLLGFILVAKNQLLHLKAYKQWKSYATTERNYLVVDIATKLAFVVILIVGLKG